jgi:WD40 repeat protein
MNGVRAKLILFLAAFFTALLSSAQFYQGSQNEFGKNRVQYRDFLWQQYRFEEFDTYFYEGGQKLASFTSKIAKSKIAELEDLFDHSINDKIQFIVYNTQTDFKQSNIGITTEEHTNIGGSTRIVGSKVFVYFEGDYVAFEKQIKDGLSRVLINRILYGGNWRDVIKSSTLLNLPEWYIDGLILYASGNISPDAESRIRDGIMSGEYDKFNRIEGKDSHIAGYALWKYVADVYGENIIPNILYMSRVSRNVESGFLYVLGKSLDTITAEFVAYYHGNYTVASLSKEPVPLEPLPIKTKKRAVYTQFELSPDGRYATYVSNILGQYRVYLFDVEKSKRKKLLKAEHKLDRIVDYSFPVMAWHPSGEVLSYIQEKRGRLWLKTYNIEENKTTSREIFRLDKVLSMTYSPDGRQLIFSAVDNGQTDLYLYYFIGNRQERLTNDIHGDFDPSFSFDGNKVIFSSNRPDDTLRATLEPGIIRENRDVFAFNLKTRSPYLERITDTPDLIELDPHQYDSIRYTFRADFEGIQNRYVATYDSVISRIDTTIHYRYFTNASPLTNYQVDLLKYSVAPKAGQYGIMTYTDSKYRFYRGSFRDDIIDGVSASSNVTGIPNGEQGGSTGSELGFDDGIEELTPIVVPEKPNPDAEVDIENYQFEGEQDFDYERETITITELEEEIPAYEMAKKQGITILDTIPLPGARNYNVNFTTDEVLTQLDNTFMTEFYQNLSTPDALNPGIGGLINYAASDLFEDYKILGGFMFSFNLDNNTVLLMGEDLSRRVDRRLQLFRAQQRLELPQGGRLEIEEAVTYSGAYRLSYPVNEVFSFRGSFMYRYDRFETLATDRVFAAVPATDRHYAGLKGEIVFDNVLSLGLNLWRGMRWKVWGEYYRDPLNFETDFMTFGLDFRHYQKLHRKLIWANRFAWSSSLGAERLAFFLGGVDNWMFPRSDNSLPLDPEQNFQFQTRGSPMRGFIDNVRNGNSFAVINTELRWPVFSYFFNKPLKSDFLENFQIIGFGDIGSAWTGPHPYSDENTFNSNVTQQGNLTIEVLSNRDPVVYGYGFGLRSRLLGYFVRVDWAWGVDDGVILDRVFYFSLALDF